MDKPQKGFSVLRVGVSASVWQSRGQGVNRDGVLRWRMSWRCPSTGELVQQILAAESREEAKDEAARVLAYRVQDARKLDARAHGAGVPIYLPRELYGRLVELAGLRAVPPSAYAGAIVEAHVAVIEERALLHLLASR